MAGVDGNRGGRAREADRPHGSPAAGHWWAGREDAVPEGLDWLSPREQARLEGVRFTKRRTEYLLRRWVGKRAVAARLDLPTGRTSLAGIEVLNRMTGAPYLAIDGVQTPWEISLSDRAGCAVALIRDGAVGAAGGAGAPVGIDLEVVEPRSDGFLTDFLTAAEQVWVTGPAAEDERLGRDAAANLVWSAKEAALKVLRLGLRADTRWVEVALLSEPRADGWARFSATWRGGRALPGWWRRDGLYLLTVAAADDGEPPVLLPGAADLGRATPVHSWVARPLVTPSD